MGIQALAWKAYTEKFMPSILKMADLKHTSVSRFGAANIIAATTNYAAENNLLTESLLQTFIHLCEDPDIIRRGGACEGGSRCAGSGSRRGSR